MIDYDASRSKLRKLIDKPSEDPTKLPRAQQEHDEAKEVFDLLNDQLIAELPQLLDLRIPFFDPSFEAMIRIQSKFAEEGYEKMSGVQRYFADNVRDDYAAGQLDAQVSLDAILGCVYSIDKSILSAGRRRLAGNERIVDMWRELISIEAFIVDPPTDISSAQACTTCKPTSPVSPSIYSTLFNLVTRLRKFVCCYSMANHVCECRSALSNLKCENEPTRFGLQRSQFPLRSGQFAFYFISSL